MEVILYVLRFCLCDFWVQLYWDLPRQCMSHTTPRNAIALFMILVVDCVIAYKACEVLWQWLNWGHLQEKKVKGKVQDMKQRPIDKWGYCPRSGCNVKTGGQENILIIETDEHWYAEIAVCPNIYWTTEICTRVSITYKQSRLTKKRQIVAHHI